MARTVVAIYDDFQTANAAVRELVDNGFPRDNISLIANNARGEYGYTNNGEAPAATTGNESVADETGAGAGVGAGIGAAIGGIGGLLIGLGALTIPGIGPVIAAGPLAVALSTLTGAGVGAVAGGVTGGLLGALIGLGIPEEEAGYYAEGVRRGGVLVTVQVEDQDTERVMDVLNHHNPMDINERVAQWKQQGWQKYDPNDKSYEQRSGQSMSQAMDRDLDRSMDRTLETPSVEPGNIPMTSGTGMPSRSMDRTDMADFDPQNPVYRSYYDTYLAETGNPYDYYVPAYRYGHGLARDPRYQNRSWDMMESNIRQDWELEHPGTWERFKMVIRHAWEDVTGQ